MHSFVSTQSFGEGSAIDVVINVRHDGSFDQTMDQYSKYLKELCPCFNQLETLHQIEEDTGTYNLAKQIAQNLSQRNLRVLVIYYKNSRIVIEQNRLKVEGEKDRRIREIANPAINPKLYKEFINRAIIDHQENDEALLKLLKELKKGGVYIDLHSMANRCPIPQKEYTKDKCVPIDLHYENLEHYLKCWQNPSGEERKHCFLASLCSGERADSEELTHQLRAELAKMGETSTLDSPYSLRPAHASYRDALLAKQKGFMISIPDLKKSLLCDEKKPGIFTSNTSKIAAVGEAFTKAIQQSLNK